MLRPLFVGSVLLASSAGLAQTAAPSAPPTSAAPKADDKKADDKKADDKSKKSDKKDEKKADAAPATTTAPTTTAPTTTAPATTTTPTAEAPPALPPAVGDTAAEATAAAPSDDELAKMKAQLKSELKAEVQAELKAQLQNEMEAASRDQATAKAAAQEWQEERWIEEVKPKLNFLELDGYFRFRFDVFNRLDLGTYDPAANGGLGRGTSNFPTPTLYRPFDGEGCTDGVPANAPGDPCSTTAEDTQSILSANMRLRIDPTLNVSEDIRIRSTIDVFDNLVLGSTPESLPGFAQNPTLPLPLFASSQNPPQEGLNSIYDAIRIRRVWAEVMTPVGQLRFGRMDQQFGLGLLANNGNKLDQDFGDNSDQVIFGTRIAGHIVAPGYSFSSSGPFGRGGGEGAGGDLNQGFFQGEAGQRYNLDPKDDVHSFLLVIAKKDKEEDIDEQLRQGNFVANYGVFGVYRTQQYDIPSYYSATGGASVTQNPPVDAGQYVKRNANAGIGSLWGRFQYEKFKIEAEAVGIVGQADGTATSSGGITSAAADLKTVVDGKVVDNPLFILQGGAAVESSYKFLGDALEVGLDGGIASGDDAPGMGLRPVINQTPKAGDLDGKQYGECLDDGATAVDGVTCKQRDNDVTNFRFDSDYIVDMILFREVLGTVTDAFYVKPHIGYSFTPDLGVRADVIYSQAIFASSTPGQQNPLGLELDAKAWYATDDGFYFMPQFGVLLPFAGLNHYADTELSDEKFRTAQLAWTGQLFAGVQF